MEPVDPETARRIERLFARAASAHPHVLLDSEIVVPRVWSLLQARLAREGVTVTRAAVHRAIDTTHAPDLYLAVACDLRRPGAWERLAALYGPRLRGLARHRGAGDAEADELAADLPSQLFVPPASGKSASVLGGYDGSVPLFDWLAVILVRRQADLHRLRRGSPAGQSGGTGESVVASDPTQDPARRAANVEAASAVAAAFREAWGRLTPRERLVLVCKHRDGMPQQGIAVLLGIGAPRVSRLAASAVGKLRAHLRQRVPEASRGEGSDFWAHLAAGIRGHLTTCTDPAEQQEKRGVARGI